MMNKETITGGHQMNHEIFEKLKETGIYPIIVMKDAENASTLGEILKNNGMMCAEVSFRTDAAEEIIRVLRTYYSDLLIGAGTVATVEQAEKAINAGAQFIVSNGMNQKVSKYVMEKGMTMIPGVCSPTDIEDAINLGIHVVKYFPAEAMGGVKMIKALAAAYPMMKFIPTGGINTENADKYLEMNSVLACGGSWMVGDDLNISEQLVKEAVDLVKRIRK